MTRTKKTMKWLMTVLLSLAITVAMCTSMLAFAANTATETVVIHQKIEKGTVPARTSYTYWLTPENEAYPLPKELDGKVSTNGKYEVGTINGTSTDSTALTMTFEIDKSEPGTYVYYLEKTPETPTGETFTLEKWKFGFRVTTDEKTGELVAFPEVCVGGDSRLSDYDKDGYPTKLTMLNSIRGKTTTTSTTTTTTTTTTKKGQTTRTYYNGTTRAPTRGGRVNTGDESNLIMWVVILGVAVLGLLVVILLQRRGNDNDEENR